MGLGFNENLMASLADHGMGSFNYLEHLEALASILETELSDSRCVLAEGSEVRITLPVGMELQDVAGLPYSREGRTIVIRTGQLIQNSTKRFTTTLHVANHELAEYSIANIELDYKVGGRSFQQRLQSDDLTVACVAPDREEEVVASVDKDLFRDAWIRNNLGALMRNVGNLVREGKREEAKELVNSYKHRLDQADGMVPGLKRQADEEVQELESRVENAFRGRARDVKQNRAAKALLDASQKLQREVKRNGQ
jgi:Ca-activated chloride channel family protein